MTSISETDPPRANSKPFDGNDTAAEPAANILIVDDDPFSLSMLKRMLADSRFCLHTAENGDQALAKLQTMDTAVILMDVAMPRTNGFDTVRKIRELPALQDIPVIFVTGKRTDTEHIAKGFELGAVDYILKPPDQNKVKSRVGLLVELYRKTRRIERQSAMIEQTGKKLEQTVAARNRELVRLKREISERKRFQALLEHRNRELDDFAATVSHDLREPLRSIANFASMLKSEYETRIDADGRMMLDFLVRLAARIDERIAAVLEYARIGREAAPQIPTDIHHLVSEGLEEINTFLKDHNAVVRIEGRLPVITCNAARISKVFHNLVTNAVKYNDSPAPEVIIGWKPPADPASASLEQRPSNRDETVFYVRDNGIGMDPRYTNTIFDMFKRLHSKERYGGGTGAGLTISKKIVEQHGGTLWFESTPGGGTTFYIHVPAAPGGLPEPPPAGKSDAE